MEITMPSLAPSMTEGHLVRWLKNEGDAISVGDILAEIETDKALVEYEAPAAGVLGKILVGGGSQNIKVGTPIGWLSAAGEPVSGGSRAAAALLPHASDEQAARVACSPLARRLAQQHGLSLSAIRGSGPNGRIVRADIEGALRALPAGNVTAPAPVASSPTAAPALAMPSASSSVELVADAAWAASAAPAPAAAAAMPPTPAGPATVVEPAAEYDDLPHSGMRRVIAQRLTESKQQAPHFYLTIDCELDALLALRAQLNALRPDAKLSINDFVVRAVALALKRVPAANASWTETAVRRWRSVDISVAVATPAGLITPVVRDADRKSIGALSDEIAELARRAREGRLKPAEYQGGGFSISNLGMHGIREFAAILNPPQAGILAVGAAEPRPVVRDGALAVATVMTCTLSVDHRVVDGAVAAELLAAFKRFVEQPLAMLA